MKIKLELEIDFPDEALEYMEDAIYTDHRYIGYWAETDRNEKGEITLFEHVEYEPNEEGGRHVLSEGWVARGLKCLAEKPEPYYRLHELLQGEYDQESLDVLVQYAVFGELKYS